MTSNSKETVGTVHDLATTLAQRGRAKTTEFEAKDQSIITETLRDNLKNRYHDEVYLPRLAFWDMFNDFLKVKQPTSINLAILDPKKLRTSDYNKQLHVADWNFESHSIDTLTKTTTVVSGIHVREYATDLAKELPKRRLGSVVLGRDKNLQAVYLQERIKKINAYTITTTIQDLTGGETKTIGFNGQDWYDTFATIEQLKQARKTYTSQDLGYKGIHNSTRSQNFNGTFSAPIELPSELTKSFRPRRLPGKKEIDIAATYGDYDYLFEQTPCVHFYGEIDVSDGNKLFEHRGNETLAYTQAEALFNHIEQSALIKPTS